MKAETSSESKEPRLNDGQIRVRGLTRRFGEHVALHPLDLEVGDTERGQITGLLGPNGSGKSTLMRMLTGLIRPDAGEAFVDGVRLAADGTAIRARCSYSPGELSVYDEMRGDEHLSWFLRGRGREAKQRATELATSFELPLRSLVRSYSHGMKRQLLFAAALAPRVRVRILDEPTEGLDPSRRAQILDLMREDARAGTTILLSSHHLGEVARACDELIFLNRGRILARANSDEIESRSRQSLRLTFASAAETATAEQRFTDQGAQCSVSDEGKLNVDLGDRDPRPILAQLYSDSAWPEPRTLAYGELSLEQLYRNLYGVEGV